MTTTPTAAHVRDSLAWIQLVKLDIDDDLTCASLGQALATLALVEEQRTANLIARWDALRNPPVGIRTTVDHWNEIERLDREIRDRLLSEDVTS